MGLLLGWEFPFLVLISGTPIESRILIPFLIPETLVGFFLNSTVEKMKKCNSDSKIWNFKKNVGTQYASFCTRKTVAVIPTSAQNGCCHTYIYSKRLPPYLHLLKTDAAIPTTTQNSCHHTYIYSKPLPPYLHLLKMVVAIPTFTQIGCCHTYIYSKQLPPSLK
jgi:hypothetical protein